MPLHQIVHVVAMRHGFMPTIGPMDVIGLMRSAVMVRSASILVWFACLQFVLVNVVSVNVMQMAVVEVIGMAIVLDGRVATIRAVDMNVSFMSRARFRHGISPLCEVWLLRRRLLRRFGAVATSPVVNLLDGLNIVPSDGNVNQAKSAGAQFRVGGLICLTNDANPATRGLG